MRVLIFHGYLLRGTGSNVYNAELAPALTRLGHEVHLLCQDRRADALSWVDAVADWDGGQLSMRRLREPARCTVYRPDIGGLLPVYVADEYEGFDARPFPALDDSELERYLAANVAAVSEVAALVAPDLALANHEVMGPAVLARALAGQVPYAVKVHGSALEYTVKPYLARFGPYAREGIDGARAVLVGSRHTAERLWETIEDPTLPAKTRLGPPGVDVHAFRPRPRAEAAERIRALADRLERGEAASWGGEAGAATALRALRPESEPVVSYVGKLIVSKGVHLLLAAWPLVVARVPEARLCLVGFGTYRDALVRLLAALAGGDLAGALEIAARGRELEGGPASKLAYLTAFLEGLGEPRRELYLRSAARAAERVHFTGRLEYADVPELLSACTAQVVPSTFPEAFGMVAAEAAACGALPLSASHSGLAEVTAQLAAAVEEPVRPLLSFTLGPGAVEQLADRLASWLELDEPTRSRASAALAAYARQHFSWEGVAGRVIDAASGRLDELPEP